VLNKVSRHEDLLGGGSIAPRILDLDTRRWVASLKPRPFYTRRKSPRHPLDRRLGGPHSRSGRGGEEKNSQRSPEIEPPKSDRIWNLNGSSTNMWNIRKVKLDITTAQDLNTSLRVCVCVCVRHSRDRRERMYLFAHIQFTCNVTKGTTNDF
jgi:hypothetical protein